MKLIKRICAFLVVLSVLFMGIVIKAEEGPSISAKGAILIESSTGKTIYEYNADEAFPPASITKIMTLIFLIP